MTTDTFDFDGWFSNAIEYNLNPNNFSCGFNEKFPYHPYIIPITNFQQYVTNHGLAKCDITEITADQYNEYDDLNHVIIVVNSTKRIFAIDITSGI